MSTLSDVEQGPGPVMGIDPGLDGGIAWIGPAGAEAIAMPLLAKKPDPVALIRLFEEKRPSLVLIESISIRPGQSGSAALTIGSNWGVIVGVLAGLKIPYEIVDPQRWKKGLGLVFKEASVKGETPDQKKDRLARQKKQRKEEALALAQRLFPALDLRENARCKVPHEGKSDALLIAEYGRRQGAA